MATFRSKPTRRMSQPSPLPQRCDNAEDADDKLFFPVSRSSSNVGIFQLPPAPLNRQDSHESSSSENDPTHSPSAVTLASAYPRPPFCQNSPSPEISEVTAPATINTSTAYPNPNDTHFSSVPFSSNPRAFFATPSIPHWTASENVSNLYKTTDVEDKACNGHIRTNETKNTFRPPSPYGEIVEPSLPVISDGGQSFQEIEEVMESHTYSHNETSRPVTTSHFPSPKSSSSFTRSASAPLNTRVSSHYIYPNNKTLFSSSPNTSINVDHNDKNTTSRLNNGHTIDNETERDTFSNISLENNPFPEESNSRLDEFTTVLLNNDSVAELHSSKIKFFSPFHTDHPHSFDEKDNLKSLSLNSDSSNDECKSFSRSMDSDHDSGKTTTSSIITNQNSSPESCAVKNRRTSIVDGLLQDIRDRLHLHGRSDSVDSDTMTECSSTSDAPFSHHGYGMLGGGYRVSHLNRSVLQNQSPAQLKRKLMDLQRSSAQMNASLVKHLKRRDRHLARLQRNCDIVTAVLQASSLKRQIDTRMKFSIQPPPGESAFDQWRDAMKAVCRLPMGIPSEFRKKAWLSLADHYLFQLKINWEKTVRFVFNERSNPDDEQLGEQIVKDLHRTGCSNFSGEENEEDRAILKRLLLAYARWNKRVGYCQGFNVIAALLLNVMDRREDDALKVMIYLIDSVLPESYFANNLRALSVDMAVFRDLLRLTYPRLSNHLDKLQLAAQDVRTGACYEPPLPNVFTMQWFLTLFATCLPISTVLRVWDSILLEGSEILLRTALTIWGKLAKRIMTASSADEFYCLMGELTSSIMQGSILEGDAMIKSIYGLGEFPFPQLHELREKYTYNIRPFTPASSASGSGSNQSKSRTSLRSLLHLKYSDEDDLDDDDIAAMACMPGDVSGSSDISVLGPGVYGEGRGGGATNVMGGGKGSEPHTMERMTTDIQSLKMQYERLKQRQQQAHIIIAAASAKKAPATGKQQHRVEQRVVPPPLLVANIESPTAMNHLFVGKTSAIRSGASSAEGTSSSRNRFVTDGPRISGPGQWRHPGNANSRLSTQLQAVARAQAVSKSRRMRTGISLSMSQTRNDSDDNEDDIDDGAIRREDDMITSKGDLAVLDNNSKSYSGLHDNQSAPQTSRDLSPIKTDMIDEENGTNANEPGTDKSADQSISKSTTPSIPHEHDNQYSREANTRRVSCEKSVVQSLQTDALETRDKVLAGEEENFPSLNKDPIHTDTKVNKKSTCTSEDLEGEYSGGNLHIPFNACQEKANVSHTPHTECAKISPASIIPSARDDSVECLMKSSVKAQSSCVLTSLGPSYNTGDGDSNNKLAEFSAKEPCNTSMRSVNASSQVDSGCSISLSLKDHPKDASTDSDYPYSCLSDQKKGHEFKSSLADEAGHMGNRSFSPICNEDSGVDSSPASSPMVPENSSFSNMANKACLSMSFLDEEMILRVESETIESCENPFQEHPKSEKHLQNIRVIMTMGASGETAFEAQGTYKDCNLDCSEEINKDRKNFANNTDDSHKSQCSENNAKVSKDLKNTNDHQARTLEVESTYIDDRLDQRTLCSKITTVRKGSESSDQQHANDCQSKIERFDLKEISVADNLIDAPDQNATDFEKQTATFSEQQAKSSNASTSDELSARADHSQLTRSVSLCSNESISVLLEAVTTSSPVKEVGYVRSTSVIETVPVAETVDVFISSQGSFESVSDEEKTRGTKEETLLKHKENSSGKSWQKVSKGGKIEESEDKPSLHSNSSSSINGNHLSDWKPSNNIPQTKGASLSSATGAQQNPARRSSQPFNPFPVKHFNTNRMKAGLKLGLYTPSTLEQLRGLKSRTTSS